jgi:hypothetical protein
MVIEFEDVRILGFEDFIATRRLGLPCPKSSNPQILKSLNR